MKSKLVCATCILATLLCVRPAHAAVIVTLEQVGSNVVATGSGTVNLTGLTRESTNNAGLQQINPGIGVLLVGNGGNLDTYSLISGPSGFGPGGFTQASTGTGDPLAILMFNGDIQVPHGYVSGASLSSTATWNGTTLSALGVIDGIYTWTWGSGANADSLTLDIIAPTSVPEPAPALLLALGAAALVLLTRRSSTLSRKQ